MSWPFLEFPLTDDDIAVVIRSHEITLELARTRGLIQLLNDLHDSHDLRQDMKEHPQNVLKLRKIKIPKNASVTLRDLNKGGWKIEVRMEEGGYIYINGYSTKRGFFQSHSPYGSES